MGNWKAGGLPSFIGGAYPPAKRKEGDANVYYLFGLSPNRYLLGSPCRSVSSDIQGKTKIAAITANNDGLPCKRLMH